LDKKTDNFFIIYIAGHKHGNKRRDFVKNTIINILYRAVTMTILTIAAGINICPLQAMGDAPEDGGYIEAGPVEADGGDRADESLKAVIAKDALAMIGIPYASGGESPETGFDCSGLAYYIYLKHGIKIPRTAFDQFSSGGTVEFEGLQKGDLVFFQVFENDIYGLGYLENRISEYVKVTPTHTGIYVGNGKFVHSPKPGSVVKLATFENRFWRAHFIGAKRYAANEYAVKDGE